MTDENFGAGNRARAAFDSSRCIYDIAGRCVLHLSRRSYISNNGLTRINANTDFDGIETLPLQMFIDALQRPHHLLRSLDRMKRSIIIGDWSAEYRHDAITHEPVHGTAVRLNCFDDGCEILIQKIDDLLRCHGLGDRGEPPTICKQYGYLAALSVQCDAFRPFQ